MEYYHVRIYQKSDRLNWEAKSDLMREELERRVVEPYRKGRPITIRGKTIEVDDIDRISVYRTDQSWQAMCLEADDSGGTVDSVFAEAAEDVTDEWITGAPGSGASIEATENRGSEDVVDERIVFVVHGRNEQAREALFVFLRAIGLRPMEWAEVIKSTGKTNPYIWEILDTAFSRSHAVVVLLTPDDEARLRIEFRTDSDGRHEVELSGQARPNVLFEAGMAMGRDHERTILVELGVVRPFSDVAGLHVVRLDDTPERRQELAQRLRAAGCVVNTDGSDWYRAGRFGSAVERVQRSSELSDTEARPSDGWTIELSEEASVLLVEAAKSDGAIYKIRSAGGLIVKVNGRSFGETGNRRSEAMWEGAIGDLANAGLVGDPTGRGKRLELTREGYGMVEQIATRDPNGSL